MNQPSSLQCAQCGATLPASTQASIPCHFCGYMNYAPPPAPAPAPPPAGGYGQPPMPWYGQQSGPLGAYQPPMSPYQPPGGKDNVDTAMVVSIVSLFACGGLFAIPAIVLAVQARDAKNRGDFAMAQAKAKQSLTAAAIAIGALVVIGIIFVVLSVVASAVSSTR